MSDNEYDAEYNTGGTPRPGTSSSSSSSSAMMRWSFSQAAKQYASENKLRLRAKTRTEYRMGANSRVNRALQDLDTKLQQQSQPAMTESDFQLLKQAIENFQVRIIVHDSTTLDELKEQRTQSTNEMATMAAMAAAASIAEHADFVQSYKEKESDLTEWATVLSAEIRRVEPFGFASRFSPAACRSIAAACWSAASACRATASTRTTWSRSSASTTPEPASPAPSRTPPPASAPTRSWCPCPAEHHASGTSAAPSRPSSIPGSRPYATGSELRGHNT